MQFKDSNGMKRELSKKRQMSINPNDNSLEGKNMTHSSHIFS